MNNDAIATMLSRLEGLAIGMQMRLDDGNNVTHDQTLLLLERVQEIHDHVREATG